MLADQFLERWIIEHVTSTTDTGDVLKLVSQLILDGAREDFTPELMEEAAGRSLEKHIEAAIREVQEQDNLDP